MKISKNKKYTFTFDIEVTEESNIFEHEVILGVIQDTFIHKGQWDIKNSLKVIFKNTN